MQSPTNNYNLSISKIVLIDIVVIVLAYMVPAISHVIPIPLYYLDPMRIFVLVGYFLSRSQINGYVLALSIPLFSMWMTGHPVFVKSLLILMELCANLYIFQQLKQYVTKNIFISIWVSILLSKIIYYCLKLICIKFYLIEGSLISTPLLIQLLTVTFVSLLIFLFSKIKGFSVD